MAWFAWAAQVGGSRLVAPQQLTRRPVMAKMLVAKEDFVRVIDGVQQRFVAGETRLAEDHWWLLGMEDRFEPVRETPEVEAATQAPGEKRGQ